MQVLMDRIKGLHYYEAINDKDFDFWKEAMKSELESMYSNNVWTLVDLPPSG